MSRVQAFLQKYGMVGIGVYGGLTTASILSFYGTLRSGVVDVEEMVTAPLAAVLGEEADLVQSIKKQWQDLQQQNARNDSSSVDDNNIIRSIENSNQAHQSQQINWKKEAAYLGIATMLDSLVLPIKLAVAIPLAKRFVTKGRSAGR